MRALRPACRWGSRRRPCWTGPNSPWRSVGGYAIRVPGPGGRAGCWCAVVASRRPRCCWPSRWPTWWSRRAIATDPVTHVVGHLAEDVAYGSGVLLGCLRARTAAPLLPRLRRVRARLEKLTAMSNSVVRDGGRGATPGPWRGGCRGRCTRRCWPAPSAASPYRDNLAAFDEGFGFAPHVAEVPPAGRGAVDDCDGSSDLFAGRAFADRRAGRASGRRTGRSPGCGIPGNGARAEPSFASRPVEEVVGTGAPTLFQVYWCGDRQAISDLTGACPRCRSRSGLIVTLDWSFVHRP